MASNNIVIDSQKELPQWRISILYFFFPLLFSQIVALHQMISFPPHYFFILFLVFLLPRVSKRVILPFLLIALFLIWSSVMDSAYREAFQMLLEMAFGYVIARIFLTCFDYQALREFFKKTLCVWSVIVLLYMLDFYYLGGGLNSVSSVLTNWESGGTSTVFARIGIIWGNPNWLSFFYLIVFALYVDFNGRSIVIGALAVVTLFVLQTKTAIALGGCLFTFLVFAVFDRKFYRGYVWMFALFFLFLFFFYLSDIIKWIEDLRNFSSFINRQRIWEFIAPNISWYPNGLMGDGTKVELIAASDEDTLPSVFLLMRLFGWPLFFLSLFWLLPFRKRGFLTPVTFVLFGFCLTQSYLSISASCSLAFFALFLSISRLKSSRVHNVSY